MFRILNRKKRYQSDKYINLIKGLHLKKTDGIKESIHKLAGVKQELNTYAFQELKLMRTEVLSMVEDYKQVSLLAMLVSSLVAGFTIIVNLMKDSFVHIDNINGALLTIYIALFLFLLVSLVGRFASRSKDLNQLIYILDMLIEERHEINLLHSEALIEYLKMGQEIVPNAREKALAFRSSDIALRS